MFLAALSRMIQIVGSKLGSIFSNNGWSSYCEVAAFETQQATSVAASFIEIMKAHALVINLLHVLSGKALRPRSLRLTPSDSEPSHLAGFSVDLSNFLIYFVAGM